MKRKILIIVLIILSILSLSFNLIACEVINENLVGSNVNGNENTSSEIENGGENNDTNNNGETQTPPSQNCTHEYDDNYTCHDRKCTKCDYVLVASTSHSFKNGVCDCKTEDENYYTQGLIFALINNDTEFEVVDYKGTEARVTIPKFYLNKPVTSIGEGAFLENEFLTHVFMPNGLKNIGNWAFEDCSSLINIKFPNTLKTIGTVAFEDCTSLTSIIIPNSVISIGEEAFGECNSLTSVTFEQNSLLDSLESGIFCYCDKLTSVVLPSNLKNIGDEVFDGCESLSNIVLPNTVTSIGDYSFADCKSLTNLVIPNNVNKIGYGAFAYCYSLTIYCESITTPSGWDSQWNSYNLPVVWNCNNNDLASDGCIYTVIDGIRYSLKDGVATVVEQPKNITIANIASSVIYKAQTYSVTSIGDSVFFDCHSLTNIIIPKSVICIGSTALGNCISLISIEVAEDNLNYKSIDGNLYSKDGTILIQYAIGKTATEFTVPNCVTTISICAFRDCDFLERVVIPNSVTCIDDYAFYNCDLITNVVIPNRVTSIGRYSFSNCKLLNSVFIPQSVTNIGDMAFSFSELLTIYCEVDTKPDGWSNFWSSSDLSVEWGYNPN